MGAGLIQNEDRISKLESRLKNFDGYCKNCDKNEIKSVFFDQENFKQENTATKQYGKKEKTNGQKNKNDLILEENNQKDSDLINSEINKTLNKKNDFDYDFSNEEKVSNNLDSEENRDKFQTYVVKSGDSLSSISRKFFGSTRMIDRILELNDMDNADTIYAGKVLKLPDES